MLAENFTQADKTLISDFCRFFSDRHPNGDIRIDKFSFTNKRELKNIIHGFSMSNFDKFKTIISYSNFIKHYKKFDINALPIMSNESKYFRQRSNGFLILAEIAEKLVRGGEYFNYAECFNKPEHKISSIEGLSMTTKLINEVFGSDYINYEFIKFNGLMWNDWFYVDYMSDTFLLIDEKKNQMLVVMTRDQG